MSHTFVILEIVYEVYLSFQKLFVTLDEPDGVTGIMACKKTSFSLNEQLLAAESTGKIAKLVTESTSKLVKLVTESTG